VEPDYDNGRRALFQGRGGRFAAIAAILHWSSTLIRWNDNAGSAKAVNTTNIWGSMRDATCCLWNIPSSYYLCSQYGFPLVGTTPMLI
jgi:hypothetical protein